MSEKEYVDISTIGIDDNSNTPAPLPTDPAKATVSYWLVSTRPDSVPGSLDTLPAQSDVAIIGSGITGVSCAYHLLDSLSTEESPIKSITIVEARSFCSGATGRNGGHLTAASALAYTDLASNPAHLLGQDSGRLSADELSFETGRAVADILAFERDTADAVRNIIKEQSGAEGVGFTDNNNWHLCFEQAEVDAFEESLRQAEHAGLSSFVGQVRRVPKEEVDEKMDKPVGIVAVYEIPGATLHPRHLVALIFKRAQRLADGKEIELSLVTDTPVLKVSNSTVHTSKGELAAKYVVHATNGYASHLLPHLSFASTGGIIPTRAQVVAIPPTSGKHLWGMGLSAGGGYEYGHQRPGSEAPLYIFGGGRQFATGREWGVADDSRLNPEVSAFLHPYLSRVFPNSYEEKVHSEWTGIMGYTKTKDPLVGPVEGKQREYIAAGYSGHGMTRAYGCARVIADMIVADAKGEVWQRRDGFPLCYLTSPAKEMLTASSETEKESSTMSEPTSSTDYAKAEHVSTPPRVSESSVDAGCCIAS